MEVHYWELQSLIGDTRFDWVQLLMAFLPTACVLYSWYCLLMSYMIARKTGVPLVVNPISHYIEGERWTDLYKKTMCRFHDF